MYDFAVVGGGVLGLSLAWELARRSQSVCVIDQSGLGQSTSWGGAGIFPPPKNAATHDPMEQLRTIAHDLHRDWSKRLLQDTGVDNQLLPCGAIYFARSDAESAALRVEMLQSQLDGVICHEIDRMSLQSLEPTLGSIVDQIKIAYHLPDEMQLRAPFHLQGLKKACEQLGVHLLPQSKVAPLEVSGKEVQALQTPDQKIRAKHYCICTGTWAPQLLDPIGIKLPVEPWRGQLIIWDAPQTYFTRVINEGLRYFVPRQDGVLLVGATVEDVGFNEATTPEAVKDLHEYAKEIVPELGSQEPKRAWAGLRPKTPDGLPFMDRVPGVENLSVCAGHFRSGLHLSPASAVFMSSLLLDDKPPLDPNPFKLQR